MKQLSMLAVSAAMVLSASAADFGQKVEEKAKSQSVSLFGTQDTLDASSTSSLTAAQANANPAKLLTVAPGLTVKVVSADPGLAPNIDQMLLWPTTGKPTHIIACNEQGSGQVAVQRVNLKT